MPSQKSSKKKGGGTTAAHDQTVVNHYVMHYPAHAPRESDPHYGAFRAYRAHHVKTAVCYVGRRLGYDQCADAQGKPMTDQPGHPGLELHHRVLEFSLINGVDLQALQLDFPDLTDIDKVREWAETDANLMFLCPRHHRGVGGIHHAAAADFSAELYVRDLIGPFK